MVAVRFPDGVRLSAQTWPLLEEKLKRAQVFGTVSGDFREEMQRRARVWSKTDILIDGTSRDFFCELERAQMLLVIPHEGATRKEEETPDNVIDIQTRRPLRESMRKAHSVLAFPGMEV